VLFISNPSRYSFSSCLRTAGGRGGSIWHVFPAPHGIHTVGNARGKIVRPFVHRLIRNADCFGGCGDGAAQQFNGLSFEHGRIKPRFNAFVNSGCIEFGYD